MNARKRKRRKRNLRNILLNRIVVSVMIIYFIFTFLVFRNMTELHYDVLTEKPIKTYLGAMSTYGVSHAGDESDLTNRLISLQPRQ